MAANSVSCLCITSNIGSVFEEPEEMLVPWAETVDQSAQTSQAKIIALHFQETGGRDFRSGGVGFLPKVIECLSKQAYLSEFGDNYLSLCDTTVVISTFTALCSVYFIHKSILEEVQLYDFSKKSFSLFKDVDKTISTDTAIQTYSHSERFPQDFFPECPGWTRKGYLHTIWKMKHSCISFVNIHLFHDENNLFQLGSSPSPYVLPRQLGMNYATESVAKMVENLNTNVSSHGTINKHDCLFFGDFNFRIDTKEMMNWMVSPGGLVLEDSREKELNYKDENGKTVITIKPKNFLARNLGLTFEHGSDFEDPKESFSLRDFDHELEWFNAQRTSLALSELKRDFLPSYPFVDQGSDSMNYEPKRCPAWCDRILLSEDLCTHLEKSDLAYNYNVLASEKFVGDHKPVFLSFEWNF